MSAVRMSDNVIPFASAEPIIDPEFQSIIPRPKDDERTQLERNLLAEGCREPLVVWKEHGILLDGHNRLSICKDRGIEYKVQRLSFQSREQATNWIINNQLGRRNLHPDQASYLRGKRYNLEKKRQGAPKGNNNRAIQRGQNDPFEKTADKIATEYKVSPKTIKRDGQYTAAVDKLAKVGVEPNDVVANPAVTKSSITGIAKQVDTLVKKVDEGEITESDARAEILKAIKPAPKSKKPVDESRWGFRLMVTNQWRFPSNDGADSRDFDGGISSGVVANLAHYFTEPGDTIIDPMAGSGRTAQVLSEIPYFSEQWENTAKYDNGGVRTVLLSDVAPTKDGIVQADASESIPFAGGDFILLDPPYWKIAEGKYAHGGETIDEWVEWLTKVGRNCYGALNDGGMLALVLDDYLRSKMKQPLVQLGVQAMTDAGFDQTLTIYNNYANSIKSMSALGVWRAKTARLVLSGMKVISIFAKGELADGRSVDTLPSPAEVSKKDMMGSYKALEDLGL